MVAIANYYAQVGIGIDRKSLNNVQKYLNDIQKRVDRFSTNMSKSKGVSVRINHFSVNSAALNRAINQAINTPNVRQGIRLNRFFVSQKDLLSSINGVLNVRGRTSRIRLGARLSQESLTDMRQQIRQSINSLVVSPTINPRVNVSARQRGGSRGSGGSSGGGSRADRLTTRSPTSHNPWHNPMMVGGGVGAFMRYGMFSLPFVAGAFGLNSLVDSTTRLEGQSIMMRAAIQDRTLAAQQEQYVNQLGDRLGIRTSSMTPFYAQMYAGARGTSLEASLPQGFSDFMDYASVMGLNEEQLKGSIRAISQMISKGRIQS